MQRRFASFAGIRLRPAVACDARACIIAIATMA
jgi:hypothetical protein